MDKNNVRESYLKQSYVIPNTNMNRSFISTSLVNDSYTTDLRKSQIQNLPNYKKTDLGNNIQFIVVFQTIQIQRLSNQVQLLRVKLKQAQRMLFNSQNYEVQIRQLTEKCFAYQRERQQYRDQLDKLNKICETLYHENQMLKNKLNDMDFSLKQKFQSEKQKNSQLMQQIQKWKARYQASQKSKAKQLEDLRNLMQCQRKSMIDRQIREMTIRFQTQRSNLENQIRKARQLLQNRNREIDDYRQQIQKYEIALMELKNYENVISDNENKIILLNQQLLRLNQVLRNKQQQMQLMKQRQHKLNTQLKEQKQWQYENQNLKQQLDAKQKQIQQWRVRISRLQDEANRAKQLIHYNEQLANKIKLASKEIDRLNDVLKGKLNEIQSWKRKVNEKQMQVSKYKNLQNDVARYQSKFSMIQAENDRINGVLKTRLGEIDQWKNKYYRLEGQINNLNAVENQKKKLQQKFNKNLKAAEEMQFHMSKMQAALRNYKNIENTNKDIERKNELLTKQIERLNNLLKNQNQQIDDFRTRYGRMQASLKDFKNIQLKVKDFENKIILSTQQIERLNTLIRNKNDDINLLEKQKLQLHQKMTHYKNYELKLNENQQSLNRLNQTISSLKRDIQNWQSRYKQVDLRARELQNNLFTNSQEKDKINTMLRNKNNQYDTLRNKYIELEDDSRKINKLQSVCQEQHNQIMTYITDIESLQRMKKQSQSQIEKERNVNNQFAFKIIILSSQLQRMTKNTSSAQIMKSKEFKELQQSHNTLQSKVKSKTNEIDLLMNKISYLQTQIINLAKQFTRILQQVERSQSETQLLLKKIDQYQDYARRIHILGAEIDRLTIENKSLDEDAKKMRLKYANQIESQKKQESLNLITALRNRINERQVNVEEMRKSILDPVRRI